MKYKQLQLIVIGDLHWTGQNPRARLDNYRQALKRKLKEVFSLAQTHEAAGIICPGDIFDSPGASLSVISDLMKTLKLSPVPIYTIAGNHDLYGGNPATEYRTPYGILKNAGLINDINSSPVNLETDYIILKGHSWNCEVVDQKLDYYLTEDMYSREESITARNPQQILVTHGMLLTESPPYNLVHTLLSEVASQPSAPQVLICGHEHQGFGIKQKQDTLFINPGSLGRIKATNENLKRKPQIVLLKLSPAKKPTANIIPLESAEPGPKVVSREHIKSQQHRRQVTEEFLDQLAKEERFDYLNLQEIMDNIAERRQLPKRVVKQALKRIEVARKQLDQQNRSG